MKIWDISPLVTSQIAVFPGDTPFSLKQLLSFESGHHLQLSTVNTTLHVGAHADSPAHYGARQPDSGQQELDPYLGLVQVIEVKLNPNGLVTIEDLKGKNIQAPRVLIKTNSFPNPNEWREDFMALAPALVAHLAKAGVSLIGIDTPSVDPAASKTLDAHQMVLQHRISLLEGLILAEVEEGLYTLIALPLRWLGADATPVRAILLEKEGMHGS